MFRDIGTVRRAARLAGGVLNEVYLAEASRGNFVIRVNRVRRSTAEIERLSSFLSYLSLREIPVDGLFDWDLLCNGPRLWDVVVASSDLSRMVGGPLSRHPRAWRENFAHHLATYGKEARRLGMDITETEVRSIPSLLVADMILSGVLFALHLRQLPLKPYETADQRRQRSDRLLSDSVDDLITIDRQIANGTTVLSSEP